MKRILRYDTYLPLGSGLASVQFNPNEKRKWVYLVPSGSLIQVIHEKIEQRDRRLKPWIDVMTFDQMMRVFTKSDTKTMLTPSKQELLIKKAVQKVKSEKGFHYFRDSIDKNGWLHQIEVWLGEIRRAGITPTQLASFWEQGSEKNQELLMIYQAYHQLVNHYHFIDHEEPYFLFLDSQTVDSIEHYQGVITDQFYDFSPIQMNVLDQIAEQGLNVEIHLAYDQKRPELFNWTTDTIEYLSQYGFQIENGDIREKWIQNEEVQRSSVTSKISQSLFASFPEKVSANEQLTIIEATGLQREVEIIAAEIKFLVWEQNISLEKIALIVPHLERYENTLHEVMKDSLIPIRLPKKEPLTRNPYIQAMISLLKALLGQRDHWYSLIFSPYFRWTKKINPHQWMMIFRECGAPINKELWNERFATYLARHEDQQEQIALYDQVMQQLFHLKEAMPSKGTNKKFVAYVEQLEKQLGVKERMREYFFEHVTEETAYRDLKAYDEWANVKSQLSEMDQLLEQGEDIPIRDWLQSLILACDQSTYTYSQGKQAGLQIMKPNQIRGQEFEVVFVVGLVEGEFPRAIKNDWLLPDEERRELRQNGVHVILSQDYEKQQKYHYFQSLTAATKQIYLVYSPKTEDGKEQLRSFFIDEVVELFHEESIKRITQDISEVVPDQWEKCTSSNQYVEKLYFDLYQELDSTRKSEAVQRKRAYQQEQEKQMITDQIDQAIEIETSRDDIDSNYDGIMKRPEIIQEIKEQVQDKIWSTTQLNEANLCRFSYFSTYLLHLTKWEEKEESLTAIEKGDLFHRIMQRFFDRFRFEREEKFQPGHHETYRQWLYAIAEEEWEQVKNQDLRFLDPVLSDLDLKKILQDARQILEHETHWREKSSSDFYPQYLELSFGLPISTEEQLKGEVDPLSIEDYAEVTLQERSFKLRGKIDRVDRNDQGQFVVYDYKNGHAPTPKEIREINNLQLPIYLFVLETLFGLDVNQAVGASFYTKGEKKQRGEKPTDNRNKGMWKTDWLDHMGLSKRMKSHMADEAWQGWLEQVRGRIEQVLLQLESGDFAVLPTKDCPSYCPYQYICRKDEERMKKKRLAREEE